MRNFKAPPSERIAKLQQNLIVSRLNENSHYAEHADVTIISTLDGTYNWQFVEKKTNSRYLPSIEV